MNSKIATKKLKCLLVFWNQNAKMCIHRINLLCTETDSSLTVLLLTTSHQALVNCELCVFFILQIPSTWATWTMRVSLGVL